MKPCELRAAIVEAIAKGLSPSARRALLSMPEDGDMYEEVRGLDTTYALRNQRVIPGVTADLVWVAPPAPSKVPGRFWATPSCKLLPLGVLVRNHLLARAKE